jgi:hypothetical protein
VPQRIPLEYASVQKHSWRLDVSGRFVLVQVLSVGLGLGLLGIARGDNLFSFLVFIPAAVCCMLQFGLTTIPGWIVIFGRSELPPLGKLIGCVLVMVGPALSGFACYVGFNYKWCC